MFADASLRLHRGLSLIQRLRKKPSVVFSVTVVVFYVILWILNAFLLQTFYVPSGSMENTFHINDRIIVNKTIDTRYIRRGDAIVFKDPGGWSGSTTPHNFVVGSLEAIGLVPKGDFVTKRVIAVGGDTVSCGTDGKLRVNGYVISEPYLFHGDSSCSSPYARDEIMTFTAVVPHGRVWVMGDHRSDSKDSRMHGHGNPTQMGLSGSIPTSDIVGDVVGHLLPLNRFSVNDVNDESAFSALW